MVCRLCQITFASHSQLREPRCSPFLEFNMTPRRCAICDQELSVHERATGDLCRRIECKQIATRVYAQAKTSLHNQQLEAAEAIAEQISSNDQDGIANQNPVRQLHGEPDSSDEQPIPVVVPSNDNRLQHRTKAERRTFLDRLGSLISQAAAVMAGHSGVEPDELEFDPIDTNSSERQYTEVPVTEKTATAMLSTCAFCRGKCCLQGKLHAFLTANTILRFMRENPTLRPRDVWQQYVERIPDRSCEGGCIYQSSQGCTLTREMRSSVCNGYECKGLIAVREAVTEHQQAQLVLVSVGEAESMPSIATAKRPPGPVSLPVIQIPWAVQRVATVADGVTATVDVTGFEMPVTG